eukprot:15365824-Ditylum_brightwellii.AAC.1
MLLRRLKGSGQHQLMLDEMYPCHLLLGLGYHVPTIQVCQCRQLPLLRPWSKLELPGECVISAYFKGAQPGITTMELTVHNLICTKYELVCIDYVAKPELSGDHFGSPMLDIKQVITGQPFWPCDDPEFTFYVIIGHTLTVGKEGIPYLFFIRPTVASIMSTPTTSMSPGLTRSKTAIFFMSPTLMDVVKETLVELGKEGINETEDLVKFNLMPNKP